MKVQVTVSWTVSPYRYHSPEDRDLEQITQFREEIFLLSVVFSFRRNSCDEIYGQILSRSFREFETRCGALNSHPTTLKETKDIFYSPETK